MRVRYNECDAQGVVFNGHYLGFFDVAITELWREFGGYQAMLAEGVDMVVAEARIRYLTPLRFDDEFDLVVRGIRVGNTSMTTELAAERDGQACAEGELRHVFLDAAEGVKTAVPDEVRDGLAPYSA